MTKRLRFGPFVLDVDRATLTRDAQLVELQPKVFDLLALLAAHPDRIFSKQELMDRLWPGTHVTEASLHQSFRKARKALGDDPDQPHYIEVVSRRGWRWRAPTAPELARRPGSDFVGREAELGAVMNALSPGKVVLLQGPGGIGKTRLAREAVALAREGGQAACAEISLLGCTNAVEIARAVARQLDIPLETAQDSEAAVARALQARAMLVLLDEAEAVAGPLASLLDRWSAPEVSWLVTSRVALDLPDMICVLLPPLPAQEASSLLRARAARHELALSEPEVQAVLEPLEGLPLAIELAAGRLRLMPAFRLAERLRAGLQVLSSGEGRGLHATLQASWELLSESDRHLLCGCAVFGGPFSAEEAERYGEGDVLDGLDRLVGASLLARVGTRLELAGLIRTLAELRAQEGYGAAFVQSFVTQTAERARASLHDAARFDTDTLLSLREGLTRWAAASSRAQRQEDRDALAVALAFACRYGGPWDLADEALATLRSPAGLARTLRGEYAARLGRLPEAERWLEGVPGEPWAQMLLARLHVSTGRLDSALVLAQSALQQAEGDGDRAVAALALDVMGTIWRVRGEPERVRDCYARALVRLLAPRDRLVRAVVAQNQAASLGGLGLHEEGIVGLAHALDALDALPVPHLVAVVRGNLALALLAAGRAQEAAPLLEVALAQARRSGDRWLVAKHAIELSLARAMAGDGPETERLATEASAMGGDPVRILLGRAWAALARGEPTRALAHLGSALDTASERERREVWPLLCVVARKAGEARLAERVQQEHRDNAPPPEFLAWMDAGGPRPELALIATGRMPLDSWAVWALLGDRAPPGL